MGSPISVEIAQQAKSLGVSALQLVQVDQGIVVSSANVLESRGQLFRVTADGFTLEARFADGQLVVARNGFVVSAPHPVDAFFDFSISWTPDTIAVAVGDEAQICTTPNTLPPNSLIEWAEQREADSGAAASPFFGMIFHGASAEPEFLDLGLDGAISACVMPIICVWPGEEGRLQAFAQGTAVMVGDGLAVTAAHVVTDFFERVRGERLPSDQVTHRLGVNCAFFLRQPTLEKDGQPTVWRVTRTWFGPSDIAVLRLVRRDGTPAAKSESVKVGISVCPPEVGDRVVCVGFHSSTASMHPADEFEIAWDDRVATTTGEVTEVFRDRRDLSRLPFPCFETDMRIDGGMSGGPVFDSAGRLCGIATSSFPPASEDERHASYCATLWPLLGALVNEDLDSQEGGMLHPAIALARSGYIYAPEHVFVDVQQPHADAASTAVLRPYATHLDRNGVRQYNLAQQTEHARSE